MSSELTIDIQLTEMGFSSWDFQVLKQKETHQSSDLECASSSSSSSTTSLGPMTVEVVVNEDTDVGQIARDVCPDSLLRDNGSRANGSLLNRDSTETGRGENSKTLREDDSGHVREKRRKCPWYDESADEQPQEDKKKRPDIHQRKRENLREKGAQRQGMSDDISGEEEEEENEEDQGEFNDTELTKCRDELSSDTNDSEEYRCQICDLTFSSTFLLHEHLHVHNGVRLYRCAECGKQFCHLVNYRKHLRSHAQVSAIQCIVCRAQFATKEDLQHHLDRNHFEDKFYQCDLCKRIFSSMAECKKHVQTHKWRSKRYPCPKCEHSFRHRSSLLYHLKRHNKGIFLCTDCGLAFSTKAVLLRHSFHHLGLLPYTCIRCKRHFRLSSQYLKHECKPEQLQCVACLVIFQSQEDFRKHKKDTGCWGEQTPPSTKANDIRCMECGQVFDSSEELKKHAGTHQRVMRCSECGMGFRSSIMLMSHMGGHAAKRPCLCKECGLGFSHQQAYDSHIKTCGLVKSAETATKKQKASLKKKETVAAPQSKEIQTVPDPVPLQPPSGQTQPAEGLTTSSPNNEPLSPVPLLMLLPVPSTSAPDNIQNPQKLNSDLSAPQVIHIPLPTNNCSVGTESDNTVLLKDMASPVPGSNLLIPLTSVKNGETGWTLLEGPCTSGTKIYPMKKQNEQVADIVLKPVLYTPQLNAKSEQKQKVLSNLEIMQILKIVKKKGCDENRKECPSSSPEQSSDAQLASNIERDAQMQPQCPDINSTAVMLDTPPDKGQTEDQTPKSLFHSSPKLNMDELSSENSVQNMEKPPAEEALGLDIPVSEPGEESEMVQCETCGEMMLEKDLIQHSRTHYVTSVLAMS